MCLTIRTPAAVLADRYIAPLAGHVVDLRGGVGPPDDADLEELFADQTERGLVERLHELRTERAVKAWLDMVLFQYGLCVVRRRGRQFGIVDWRLSPHVQRSAA